MGRMIRLDLGVKMAKPPGSAVRPAGLSIAWAALRHLHEINRCRTLFGTHYHELTALAAKLPALACFTRCGSRSGRATSFADVDPASQLAQREVFGPVLAITPFRTEDEAVEIANSTPYGLSAYIQTTDLRRAHRVAEQARHR